MKKWILSAICLVLITGYAAAQKIAAVPKNGKEDSRKGIVVKQGTDSSLNKVTNAAPFKLIIAAPVIATLDAPAIKQD